MASVANDILDAVVAKVEGLNLQLDGTVPVVKRKLPKKGQTVDQPVQITVCLDEKPFTIERLSFEDKNVEILVLVVIISPNRGDQATNLPLYTEWQQQIADLFEMPLLDGVAEVWDTDVEQEVFLDRQALATSLDYQAIGLRFQTAQAIGA